MPFPDIEHSIVEFFAGLPQSIRVGLTLLSLPMEYGAIVWLYLLLLAVAGLREWQKERWRSFGRSVYLEAVIATAVGMALQALLNTVILQGAWNRPRPFELLPVEPVGPTWRASSFVSSHTLAASVAATILSHYFPDWASEYGVFAFLIGISRLATGTHWPSDVLAAWFLGIGLGFFVLFVRTWLRRR